jgi:osmotically-inducible protein OsmY
VIFRDDSIPKGKIDVNAADGVVWLRGEARTPEMIKALAQQASEIPEVKQVENLLHLPKTPAPTRTTVGNGHS